MAALAIVTDLDKILKNQVYPAFLEEHKAKHTASSGARTVGWAKGTGYGSGSNSGSWTEIDKRAEE